MPKIAYACPLLYPLNAALVGGSDFHFLNFFSGEMGKRFMERKHVMRHKAQMKRGIWSVILMGTSFKLYGKEQRESEKENYVTFTPILNGDSSK